MLDYVQKVLSYKKDMSIKALSSIRRQSLKEKEFTIISNNCWAGWVYRRYGIEYQTPTVGLYMFAQDYIQFCKRMDYYLGSRLTFIPSEESRYFDSLVERKQQHVPIGLLGNDVEVVFLHYHDEKEAYEKWNRRAERIRTNNLIFKFSEMDLCKPHHIEEFDRLPYEKKVCFTANPYPQLKSCIRVSKIVKDNRVADDTSFYANYIDLTVFLNTGSIRRKSASQTLDNTGNEAG